MLGGNSNDVLIAGEGNDSLDGGNGSDTAVLTGAQAGYIYDAETQTLTDVDLTDGDDGTITFTSVERFEFTDGTLEADELEDNLDDGQSSTQQITTSPIGGFQIIDASEFAADGGDDNSGSDFAFSGALEAPEFGLSDLEFDGLTSTHTSSDSRSDMTSISDFSADLTDEDDQIDQFLQDLDPLI